MTRNRQILISMLLIVAMDCGLMAPAAWSCTCTIILDDFNRANEGPPPSSSWSTPVANGDASHYVRNNGVGVSADDAQTSSYWNVTTYGPDVEACASLTDTSAFLLHGAMVRIVNPNNASTAGGYMVVANPSTSVTQVYRLDGTTYTLLGADISTTWANGDAVCIKAVGATIEAFRKPSGGSWGSIGSRTDSTYSSAGYSGVFSYGGSGVAIGDNFGSATIASSVDAFFKRRLIH